MKAPIIKAFAVSPLPAAIAIAVANGVIGGNPSTIPFGILVYLPFSYLLVFLFGSPTFFLLRVLKLTSCRAYGIAGAMTGIIIALLLPLLMVGKLPTRELNEVPFFVLLSAVGSMTAVVFWWLAFGSLTKTTHEPQPL